MAKEHSGKLQNSGLRADWRLFLIAGLSNSAGATVGNPMDVIKIRLQLDNELSSQRGLKKKYYGMMRGMRILVLEEGYMAIWKGWSAAILREMSFSAIRMGAYEPIKYKLGGTDKAHTAMAIKVKAAAISGAIGAAIATPTDLVKVRLQAQVSGTKARHSGCITAFRDIYATGGLTALYTGCAPNILRAMAATVGQLVAYDHTKHVLLNANLMQEGLPLHIISSTVAGFMNAAAASPIDIVKTRLMNQPEGKEKRYNSMIDAWYKTIKAEGVWSIYKGFIPCWLRIGPHTMVTFAVFEQLRVLAGIEPV
ncbi:mitochondrial substrate carrier family protein ucpB-like [Watersipora subatra]|uniref:mitochondrial substrate carrier family protein ucpB-like n=1 Tax=Watersipora subatra TaxID=2589382 RepID=UPI00355C1223